MWTHVFQNPIWKSQVSGDIPALLALMRPQPGFSMFEESPSSWYIGGVWVREDNQSLVIEVWHACCSPVAQYIYNYIYLYFFVWACGNIIFRSRYMFKDEMIVNGSYFLHVQLLLTCTDSVFENWKKEPMKNNPHGNHQHSSARQGRISDQL